MQDEIIPYPPRKRLDQLEYGMDDEATSDPEGDPWDSDTDDAELEKEASSDVPADDPPEFDPSDWADPVSAKEKYAAEELQHHCHGGSASAGGVASQDCRVLEYQAKMRSLMDAARSVRDIRTSVGESVTLTLDRVIAAERKRFAESMHACPEVTRLMRELVLNDERLHTKMRQEYQEHIANTKKQQAVANKLKDLEKAVRQKNAEIAEKESVVTAMSQNKAYSVHMLGFGKKNGGPKEHRQRRYEVLERVRRTCGLTKDQEAQWEFFKLNWDELESQSHSEKWGEVFSEIINNIMVEARDGNLDAFSKFVESEWKRVLGKTGGLVAPAYPMLTDTS